MGIWKYKNLKFKNLELQLGPDSGHCYRPCAALQLTALIMGLKSKNQLCDRECYQAPLCKLKYSTT